MGALQLGQHLYTHLSCIHSFNGLVSKTIVYWLRAYPETYAPKDNADSKLQTQTL